MKKFILMITMLTTSMAVYAADFDLRLISIDNTKYTIAIPRRVGGTSNFAVITNDGNTVNTSSMNSLIDAKTVTITVNFPNNPYSKVFYVWAKEINAFPAYVSATLTLTAKPAAQEVMVDRDGWIYGNKYYFKSWLANTAVGNDVVNTTFVNFIYLTEIVVGGYAAGDVLVKIDGVAIRRYAYRSDTTSGQIFSTKIPIPIGSIFEVELEGGSAGNHFVSISAEVVK